MGRACYDPTDTLMTHQFVSTAKGLRNIPKWKGNPFFFFKLTKA